MDISKIDATIAQDEEGVVVPIFAKNGEPDLASDGSQTTITVLGAESKQYRRAQDAQTRKMLRARRNKLEPDDLRANRIELAAAAVTDWHGIENDGQPFPCTPENVKAVLRAQYVLEQIEAGIAGHADFFGSNSTN